MKRPAFFSKLTILILIGLIGSLATTGRPASAADAAKTIRIGGTGVALATMRTLGDSFRERHPGVDVKVFPSLGSSGGVAALRNGDIDIAVVSKILSATEKAGLTVSEYGRTPLVFVTRDTNPVPRITLGQIVDIYAGRTMRWPDGTPVRLVIRPPGESSNRLLEGISGEMKEAVTKAAARPGLSIAVTDQDNADLLEKLPGSFGVAPLCQIVSEKRRLKSLPLYRPGAAEIPPTSDSYPYDYGLFLAVGPLSSPSTALFVEFVFSAEGQRILARNGNIPAGRRR